MRNIFLAVGLSAALQAVWAFGLAALCWLLFDKPWVADNFLAANFRRAPKDVPGLTDQIIEAMISAAGTALLACFIASSLWIVLSGIHRIYGPGRARRLLGLWFALLVVGALASGGATYYLIDSTRLVPWDQTIVL